MVKCKKCNNTGVIITRYKSGVEEHEYCDCGKGNTVKIVRFINRADITNPITKREYWIEKSEKYKKALEKIIKEVESCNPAPVECECINIAKEALKDD